MRISSAGSLLQGSIIASGGVGANTTNSGIEVGGGGIYQQVPNNSASGTILAYYYRGSSVIGSIIQNGTTQVQYNTSSDYRLKENISCIPDSLIRLQQLKPCRFNFISEPDRIVEGFIAHEVQEVVPQAIAGEKDGVDEDGNPIYQGIDQSNLVPLLTAALQEAVAKIESLEARLTAAGI